MTNATVRANPDDIAPSLKEAVVDALLNITHARIAGAGEYGNVLFGAQPRKLLNSGFLLPARTDVEGDEVTSPIWVSAHGCDLQIARQGSGEILLQPRFALYVRVLPTEDDIKRADCRPTFRLKREVALRMRHRRYELLDKRWDEVKGGYASRGKHPDWLRIAEEVRRQVHEEEGVPLDLKQVGLPDDSDPDVEPETEAAAVPTAGAPVVAKDEHFEALSIPHKWLRLELELPPLSYPVYADATVRAHAVAAHEGAMREAIEKRLADWLVSTDAVVGGQLWGFRRDVEVKPSQYRDWNKFLVELRATPGKLVRPDVAPRWDIRVAPDWLDATRLNLHIALENRSEEPKQHVDETDPSLFQVSFTASLPAGMHKPLRLERVEPSYRYNRFLDYPAMGFNGGVQRIASLEPEIRLETTWAPRYAQPRMVAISHQGVAPQIRNLARPESLASIEALPIRMREWLAGLPGTVNRAAGLAPTDTVAIAREEKQFANDLKKWHAEVEAIESGLAILRESKAAWVLPLVEN